MTALLKNSPPAGSKRIYVRDSRPAATPRFAMSSRVALVRDLSTIEDDTTVPAGRRGTIVTIHDGGVAYDVEMDGDIGVVAARLADLRAL